MLVLNYNFTQSEIVITIMKISNLHNFEKNHTLIASHYIITLLCYIIVYYIDY